MNDYENKFSTSSIPATHCLSEDKAYVGYRIYYCCCCFVDNFHLKYTSKCFLTLATLMFYPC
jgi:hypothetical protein